MSTLAPTGFFYGPTALVMSVPVNSGYKGISQYVAVAANTLYIASLWIRPDRDAAFRVSATPPSGGGSAVTSDFTLTGGVWNLVYLEWTPTVIGTGEVQFITSDVGDYEMSCGQFCRKVDQYDPALHVIPNEWSRGGLGDASTSKVTIERFESEWTEVLAETFGDYATWASKILTGGAITYSVRDLYFPLDTDLYYRARVDNNGIGVSSPDSGAFPVPAISDNRWLLVPSLPGRTGEADSGDVLQVQVMDERFTSNSKANAGVFYALGRKNAIVVSDSTVSGESGTVKLAFRDPISYAIFERIREANCAVLMRAGRYGFSRWVRFVSDRSTSIFLGTGVVRPIVTVDWVEVDPPENA